MNEEFRRQLTAIKTHCLDLLKTEEDVNAIYNIILFGEW